MNCKIVTSSIFDRSLKKLSKRYMSMKEDYIKLLTSLKNNPFQGNDLGSGLHKVRMSISSKGKGKSGGARVITFLVVQEGDNVIVRLLDIYDKSDRATLKDNELAELLKKCGL